MQFPIYSVKIGSKKQFVFLIVGAGIILGVLSIINQESTVIIIQQIQQDRVFDPLCMMADFDENSDPSIQGFCKTSGNSWSPQVGLSYYYETEYDINGLRFLAMKVNVPEIPESNPFVKSEITSAKIQLRTRYDPPKDNPFSTERFSIHHGLCDDVSWNEAKSEKELTCLSEYKYPISKVDTFYGVLDADFIQTLNLDVQSHIRYALTNNLQKYTETVRFYPITILKSSEIENTVRNCLKNVEHVSERRGCVEQYQLTIFSKDYASRPDFQPKLIMEYVLSPTPITTSLYIVSLTLVPIFGTSLFYLRLQRIEHADKITTICKSLLTEIDSNKDALTGKQDYKIVEYIGRDEEKSKIKYTNVLLDYDSYESLITSDLFSYFQKETQVSLRELYTRIKDHNRTINYIDELEDKYDLQFPNDKSKFYKAVARHEAVLSIWGSEILKLISKTKKKLNSEIKKIN